MGTTGRWPNALAPEGAAAETSLHWPACRTLDSCAKEPLSASPGSSCQEARRRLLTSLGALGGGLGPPEDAPEGEGSQQVVKAGRRAWRRGGGQRQATPGLPSQPGGVAVETDPALDSGRNDRDRHPTEASRLCDPPRVCSSSGPETGHRTQLSQSARLTTRGGVLDRAAKRHRGQVSIMVPLLREAFQVPRPLLSARAWDWNGPTPGPAQAGRRLRVLVGEASSPCPPIPDHVHSGHRTSVY